MENGALGRPDPYSTELGDWRLSNPLWIVEMGGQRFDAPRAMHQVTVLASKKRSLVFKTPSGVALHLSSAWRTANAAAEILPTLRWTSSRQPGSQEKSLASEDTSALYDYFELSISACISSFSAVEALCNLEMANRCVFPLDVSRKGRNKPAERFLDLADAERRLSTDEKLKYVVPRVMGVADISGKAPWNAYVNMKRVRDEVTHFKRSTQARLYGSFHEPTALHDLLDRDPRWMPRCAVEICQHMYGAMDEPRWLRNPQWFSGATKKESKIHGGTSGGT